MYSLIIDPILDINLTKCKKICAFISSVLRAVAMVYSLIARRGGGVRPQTQ